MIQHPKLKKAMRDMTVMHPFWASIVLHFDIEPNPNEPTFSVDGKKIYYNPKLSESWSVALNMFALAHEAGHVMLHHLERPFLPQPGCGKIFGYHKGKPVYWDREVYYKAGDYIINDMLKKSGFTLWDKCLHNKDWDSAKWTTEQVYRELDKQHPPKPPKPPNGDKPGDDTGDEESDSNASGSPQHAGDKPRRIPESDILGESHVRPPAEGFSQQEVREIVSRAMAIAKSQGKLPGSLEGMLKEAVEPQYPVFRLLESFLDMACSGDDSSWRKPHRDFFSQGIILPGEYNETVSHVVVVYDTSGSVPDEDLSRFHRVTGDILRRVKPAKLTLMQVDAGLHSTLEIKSLADWPREMKVSGRGGTDFRPAFDALKAKRIKPSCLVYLTDLCGTFPTFAPNYPVFWVSTEKETKAPFGTTVFMNQ